MIKNKSLLWINIILWIIISVLIIGTTVFLAAGGHLGMFKTFASELIKEENMDLNGIKNISVDCTSQAIECIESSSGELEIRQYGDKNGDNYFTCDRTGDTVKISIKPKFRFGIYLSQEKLIISIPANWRGNMSVSANSGSVVINDKFTWEDTSIDVTSGSVKINSDLECEELTIHVNSGSVRTASIISDKYSIKSTSGSCNIESISGYGEMICNSGSIKAHLSQITGNINAKSTSGTINFTIDKSQIFNFEASVTSGSIKTNIDISYKNSDMKDASGKVGESPEYLLSMKVNSGSIKVYLE